MPDMKTCVTCKKIFNFEAEGFAEEVEGVWLFACSEVCAAKSTLSRGIVCIIHCRKEPNTEPSLFGIHNLN